MSNFKICPYCYSEYKLLDLKINCKLCSTSYPIIETSVKSRMSLKLGVLPKINSCPSCGKTKRSNLSYQCSCCNSELSRSLIELKNKIISVVGGRGSGKTIYISLLIDELKKNIKIGEGRTFEVASGDHRDIDVISQIKDRIKLKGDLPHATEPREVKSEDSTAGVPLTYFYKGERGAIALSFYDSSGEDLQDYDTFQREYDYIRNTSGIVFIMDLFSGNENLRNTEYSLSNLIRLLKVELGLNFYSQIPIPVSFVFNKFDLYAPTDNRHESWDGSNDDEILKIINTVHGSLMQHFKDSPVENLGNILQMCDAHFKEYRFIPVSSLGFDPECDKPVDKGIKSFDIEYPYVYLLNKIN